MKAIRISLLTVVLLGGLTACATGTPTIHGIRLASKVKEIVKMPLTTSGDFTLHLETPKGDVQVVTAPGKARVVAVLAADGRTEEEARRVLERYDVRKERTGDGISIASRGTPLVVEENGYRAELVPEIGFHATVPPGTRVIVSTGAGDVTIEGPLAGLSARSSAGDVTAREVGGSVEIRVAAGDVRLDGFSGGSCVLTTAAGDITASGTFTTLEARSDAGDVGVFARRGSAVKRAWSLGSGAGDVSLRVPADLAACVDARAGAGRVRSDLPPVPPGGSDPSALIRISTGSGDITVRRAE